MITKKLAATGFVLMIGLLSGCSGGGGGGNTGSTSSGSGTSTTTTPPATDTAPIAYAGAAQNVIAGTSVTLNGSNSSDSNGAVLTYTWTLTTVPKGSLAAITAPTSAKPTFTPDLAGTYVASLVVNDGQLSSTVSTVTVTATSAAVNAAPVANAGAPLFVVAGTLVTLNGSASSDANGDALTYAWSLTTIPSGSSAAIAAPTSVLPTFTPDIAGTYVASLVVNDGQLNSAASTVTITVTPAAVNAVPVANAGAAQNVTAGTLVTLNGNASTDANGHALTYAWSFTAIPAGSAAVIAAPTSATPSFTPDVAGVYVASLIVSDGLTSSASSTVAITVTAVDSLSLWSVPSPGAGSPTQLSLPYTSSGSSSASVLCSGSGCATSYNVGTFELIASGQNYTITNLTAVNTTTGSTLVPFFTGLTNGQIIGSRQTVTFSLQSPFTGGNTVNLIYSFTVQETGATFSYAVQLKTN
ncbi:chitinase [Oxalobacteraceae bacterium GrIS 2.11]